MFAYDRQGYLGVPSDQKASINGDTDCDQVMLKLAYNSPRSTDSRRGEKSGGPGSVGRIGDLHADFGAKFSCNGECRALLQGVQGGPSKRLWGARICEKRRCFCHFA